MKSVRLRLLLLALLPISVLMPLMLVLAMTRWNADYDAVLISKVDSDLRIAKQYLGQLKSATTNNLSSFAGSVDLNSALLKDEATLAELLQKKRKELGLDFLEYIPQSKLELQKNLWPIVHAARTGQAGTVIDIFSGPELDVLPQSLRDSIDIPLIETEAAAVTTRLVEDRGMILHSAAPVSIPGRDGVLRAGLLLNRNLDFIDTINALIYARGEPTATRRGTATLFLEDTRISTNVRLFENVRALGTRVSAAVRQQVLVQGKTWLDRAFVVNDWYISGYLPLTDSYNERVGMLYVGFLEAPYSSTKQAAYWTIIGVFILVLILTAPLFLWLAKGIFSPLEKMIQTMKRVERGDLAARNGPFRSRDEIGQVAGHLDSLLDQIEDRDQRLRGWANELNERVDQRTSELRAANQKIKDTYERLVLSEKLASIGEITAGVAHEINNPVAVIQGNVEVIRMTLGADNAAVQTELDLIDNQVMRIGAIVGKLLQFARPSEFGAFAEHVDVATIAQDCRLLVDHTLTNQNITIIQEFDTVPQVRIDPGELQQVIVNLLLNAAQAIKGPGKITMRIFAGLHDNTPGVWLSVEDTGPGIPKEQIARVFDPFHTTKLGEGTGLGLSISQTLIQSSGGCIFADNTQHSGALFSIWLPTAQSGT